MSLTTSHSLKIEKCATSRIGQVNFDQLVFGTTFTDHLFECDFKNGAWGQPTIKPYGPISLDPSAKVFHYGQAVFEGMKAYKDAEGSVFLFRPWKMPGASTSRPNGWRFLNFRKNCSWKPWNNC